MNGLLAIAGSGARPGNRRFDGESPTARLGQPRSIAGLPPLRLRERPARLGAPPHG